MEQYIPKSALVAEIDRQKIGYNVDGKHSIEYDTTRKILNIIDTLEVKEVDIEKEIEFEYNPIDGLSFEEFARIAKHFFELGMSVSKK